MLRLVIATLVFAASPDLPAQELYNPVPSATAVNSALGASVGQGKKFHSDDETRRMQIRQRDASCRARVDHAFPTTSIQRKAAMERCDELRRTALDSLGGHHP